MAFPADIDDSGLAAMSSEPGSSSSDVPPEPTPSVMSGFTALSKLCRIAGRINHALYRPSHGRSLHDPHWATSQQSLINKLDQSLREWLDSEVPSKYKDPSQERSIQLVSAVLSNSYFACLITLHRNFLSPSPDSGGPRAPPSTQSLSHCVAAARSVIHIAAQSRVLLPPSHHLALFTQYLWSAAVLLLLCEVQANDQVVIDAVGSQVESTRRSLAALEPVWPGTRKLKELLIEAERRAKEVVAHGPRRGKRKTSHDERNAKRPSLVAGKRSSSASTAREGRGMRRTGQWTGGAYASAMNANANANPSTTGMAAPGQSPARPSPSLPPRMSSSSSSTQQYETSDTRTLNDDFARPITSSSLGPGHNAAQGLTFNDPHGHMGYGHGHGHGGGGQYSYAAPSTLSGGDADFVFDVGGVDFNGLEMLQGFQPDFATLWSSLMNEPYNEGMGTPQAQGQGQGQGQGHMGGSMSGATSTPLVTQMPLAGAGAGGSDGPSPRVQTQTPMQPQTQTQTQTQAAWTPSGMGAPGYSPTTPSAGAGASTIFGNLPIPDISSSEFWSAVAGAGQDWGADPNVPFNI